jgi:hydroxymethylpyrimidine pyrophosphatase-like HAD family hydrolase
LPIQDHKRLRLPPALALDLDGTLINHGGLPAKDLVDALRALRVRGTRLVLVTGRCVQELSERVDPRIFDAVVAENGAILMAGGTKTQDCPPYWRAVRSKLLPHFPPGCEEVIISADRSMGSLAEKLIDKARARIEYNKDRLMVMPQGVDKGTGLLSALSTLGIAPKDSMCIGDGENDLPMFRLAGARVALGNSVDALKRIADLTTEGEDGEGTLEAINMIIPGEKRRTGGNQA